MTHLTYWYGQFNDLPSAYSFQKTSQLLSYEGGMKKTEKKISNLRQKLDQGKKLSSKDINLIKGMEEMEKDRKERKRKMEFTTKRLANKDTLQVKLDNDRTWC